MTWLVWTIIAWIAICWLVLALFWRAARIRDRRAAEMRDRFNPKRTVPSPGIVYVDHEPTVSAMREGGAL